MAQRAGSIGEGLLAPPPCAASTRVAERTLGTCAGRAGWRERSARGGCGREARRARAASCGHVRTDRVQDRQEARLEGVLEHDSRPAARSARRATGDESKRSGRHRGCAVCGSRTELCGGTQRARDARARAVQRACRSAAERGSRLAVCSGTADLSPALKADNVLSNPTQLISLLVKSWLPFGPTAPWRKALSRGHARFVLLSPRTARHERRGD